MPAEIRLDEWLRVLDAEYLSTFIRDGGASVKFAVTPEECRGELSLRMGELCAQRGYLLLDIDAATWRAHMPQDVFFAMAGQIDWRRLARMRILGLAAGRSYKTDGVDPVSQENIYAGIAAANGLEVDFVLHELRRAIQDNVLRNPHMARDFRVAMTQLCQIEDDRGSSLDSSQPILDWLSGANTRIGNVKQFSIHTAINRTTARYFIQSALYWTQAAGYAGTVALFDNSRVMLARNPRDGLRYYTRMMAVDHYELLREFIDSADRLANALIIVTPSAEFVEEGRPRNYELYPALQTRVMNEVRDRNRGNPVASMVHLTAEV